jgi:hypothetical protein
MKQEKKLKVHTMSFSPTLNNDHLLNQLYHCIPKVDHNAITAANGMKYNTLQLEVHINDKWFLLVEYGGQYNLICR